MSKTHLVGLDWSMTCPAICIYDKKKPFKFENCQFFFMSGNKKFENDFGNIHGFKMPLYDGNQERFDIISEWAMKIINRFPVESVCLEGYSMGSKGKVFDIAENIGLLKHKLWKANLPFIIPAPTQVKKTFSGKGNANKAVMYAALLEMGLETDLEKVLNCKPEDSPISDIVDSFAMVHHLIEHNKYQSTQI